jgi:D-alanyl-D-alanine dipeptidase
MRASGIGVVVWLAALAVPWASVARATEPSLSSSSSEPAFPRGIDAVLPGLVDVGATLPVRVELKYGTTDNFMGRDVYGGLKRCFLVDDAARMLGVALAQLQQSHPSWTFVMYDCARPVRVQKIMWDVVKGTKQQGYVANPHTPPGSIHTTGCAVDLSAWDTQNSSAVDMGTSYDFFGAAAHPAKESALWKSGAISSTQWANRLALREAMLRAGFRPLAHEWWHFDCADGGTARRRYPLIP